MVMVYKAPVSLTSVFKHCYSPDLEKADFDRQSFSIYLVEQLLLQFTSRIQTKHTQLLRTTWQLRYSKKFVTTTQSKPPVLSLVTYRTLVQSYSIVILSIPAISPRGGYMFGFEYRLILSMFYVWFRVSLDTQYVLCLVLSIV